MKAAKLLREEKLRLRAKVPLLDGRAVRRLKIPFQEALLLELQEAKLDDSSKFFDEIIRQDPDKKLIKSKKTIERIFDELKKAASSSKDEEIIVLVTLAQSFENVSWLAEMVYARAFEKIDRYDLKDSRSDVFAGYFYGKFLSGKQERWLEALLVLEAAFELCYGVKEWKIQVEKEWTAVFTLISDPLCEVLLNLSKANRSEDMQGSLELAKKSLLISRKAKIKETSTLEVKSLIEVGNCLSLLGEVEKALKRYQFAFDLAEYRGFYELGLGALMQTAECYTDREKYEEILRIAKDFAAKHSLEAHKGKILFDLGKSCNYRQESDQALTYLEESLEILKEFNEMEKLQEAQLILAPHYAQQTFNQLVDTILRCDKEPRGSNAQLERLLLWYDRKYPVHNPHHEFYKDEEVDLDTFIRKFYDPDEITKLEAR